MDQADEGQVYFELWREFFGVALEGSAASGSPVGAKVVVATAAAIADEAVAEVRRRRRLVDQP